MTMKENILETTLWRIFSDIYSLIAQLIEYVYTIKPTGFVFNKCRIDKCGKENKHGEK